MDYVVKVFNELAIFTCKQFFRKEESMNKILNKYLIIKLCCIYCYELIRIKLQNLKYRFQVGIYFYIIEKCYLSDFILYVLFFINIFK